MALRSIRRNRVGKRTWRKTAPRERVDWENAVNVLKTAFTGTNATALKKAVTAIIPRIQQGVIDFKYSCKGSD